jgi:hypothetical protein
MHYCTDRESRDEKNSFVKENTSNGSPEMLQGEQRIPQGWLCGGDAASFTIFYTPSDILRAQHH